MTRNTPFGAVARMRRLTSGAVGYCICGAERAPIGHQTLRNQQVCLAAATRVHVAREFQSHFSQKHSGSFPSTPAKGSLRDLRANLRGATVRVGGPFFAFGPVGIRSDPQ
jgi:hypothetical protein